jgi:hypothetical protein
MAYKQTNNSTTTKKKNTFKKKKKRIHTSNCDTKVGTFIVPFDDLPSFP